MGNETLAEVPKSQEEIIFDDMNMGLDQIRIQRDALLKQLTQVTETTKIDFEGDAPRKTEMKLSLFKTVDDLLKSQESLLTGKAKMSLAKKSEASSGALKEMAVEILKNIDMKQKKNAGAPVAVSDQDTDIVHQAFSKMMNDDPNISIKEDELVMDEQPATA